MKIPTGRIFQTTIKEGETPFDAIVRAGQTVRDLNQAAEYQEFIGYEILCDLCYLPLEPDHECPRVFLV